MHLLSGPLSGENCENHIRQYIALRKEYQRLGTGAICGGRSNLTAIGMYRNTSENLWYQVVLDGGEIAYLYSGHCTFVQELQTDLSLKEMVLSHALNMFAPEHRTETENGLKSKQKVCWQDVSAMKTII